MKKSALIGIAAVSGLAASAAAQDLIATADYRDRDGNTIGNVNVYANAAGASVHYNDTLSVMWLVEVTNWTGPTPPAGQEVGVGNFKSAVVSGIRQPLTTSVGVFSGFTPNPDFTQSDFDPGIDGSSSGWIDIARVFVFGANPPDPLGPDGSPVAVFTVDIGGFTSADVGAHTLTLTATSRAVYEWEFDPGFQKWLPVGNVATDMFDVSMSLNVIPPPGALPLLGLGVLVAARRRR